MSHFHEEWKPVIGFEGIYAVSSFGRVRRECYWVLRTTGHVEYHPFKQIALKLRDGYPRVTLYRAGEAVTKSVHVLVAEAFIGPKPAGKVVCHNDSNRQNACVLNLRYDTQRENRRDTILAGRTNRGELHHKSKLNAADVLQIRSLEPNTSYSQLAVVASKLGVTATTVYKAFIRETWQHLP